MTNSSTKSEVSYLQGKIKEASARGRAHTILIVIGIAFIIAWNWWSYLDALAIGIGFIAWGVSGMLYFEYRKSRYSEQLKQTATKNRAHART